MTKPTRGKSKCLNEAYPVSVQCLKKSHNRRISLIWHWQDQRSLTVSVSLCANCILMQSRSHISNRKSLHSCDLLQLRVLDDTKFIRHVLTYSFFSRDERIYQYYCSITRKQEVHAQVRICRTDSCVTCKVSEFETVRFPSDVNRRQRISILSSIR